MKDMKKELWELRMSMGLAEEAYCGEEEEKEIREKLKAGNDIPPDLISDGCGAHFRYKISELTEDERQELIRLRLLDSSERQIKQLKVVRNFLIVLCIFAALIFMFFILQKLVQLIYYLPFELTM